MLGVGPAQPASFRQFALRAEANALGVAEDDGRRRTVLAAIFWPTG